jgi:very-short-patch-repair endonuclease
MNVHATFPSHARTVWERRLGATDSPIESLLMAALCECAVDHGYRVAKTAGRSDTLGIRPQTTIDRYRVDLVVSFLFHGAELHLAIECDGHAFHEKTKAQARKDRSRERALTSLGYRVVRFTGSEIVGNARSCAAEIMSLVMDFQTSTIVRSAGAAS